MEITLYDQENQAGPQGTGSYYKSYFVKERGRGFPWIVIRLKKLKKIRSSGVLSRNNENIATPWLADDRAWEVEVGSSEQEMGPCDRRQVKRLTLVVTGILMGLGRGQQVASWNKKDAGIQYCISPSWFVLHQRAWTPGFSHSNAH